MPDNTIPNNPGNGGTGPDEKNKYQTLAEFMTETHTLLTNAQLPQIATLLEPAGYPQATLSGKLEELGALRTLSEKQEDEYGDQNQVAKDLADAREANHANYTAHIGLARIAFRNRPDGTAALGLAGTRKPSLSGYTTQGLLFYNNALADADFKTALAAKGVTEAELLAGKAAFDALLNLNATLKKETGEAQQATKARDAAYDALHEWVSELRETAKIMLRDNAQLREQLGILERS